MNPDIFVDTTDSATAISVFEQLEKARSVHDSESGYGTMGTDFTFGKVPARKVRKLWYNYDYIIYRVIYSCMLFCAWNRITYYMHKKW